MPALALRGPHLGAAPITAYAGVEDGGFQLPAIPAAKIDPKFLRQRVVYDTGSYEPGTSSSIRRPVSLPRG